MPSAAGTLGARLNPAMDNWDRLEDATPHYYGDNFPTEPTTERSRGSMAGG